MQSPPAADWWWWVSISVYLPSLPLLHFPLPGLEKEEGERERGDVQGRRVPRGTLQPLGLRMRCILRPEGQAVNAWASPFLLSPL